MGSLERIAAEVGALCARKREAYGDSVSRARAILAILYPDGVRPEALGDMLLVVRVLDKVSRIATEPDALGEDPWMDIAGYALLALDARKGG